MKEVVWFSAIVATAMCMTSTASDQVPVGTMFTYQGRLRDGGSGTPRPWLGDVAVLTAVRSWVAQVPLEGEWT